MGRAAALLVGISGGIGGNASFTKLLLHCDAADASTTFTDSSAAGHNFTAAGNAQIDTAQFKFGTSSALFDGTGDYINDATGSSDFAFGTGDFAVDFWVRRENMTPLDSIKFQCSACKGRNVRWSVPKNWEDAKLFMAGHRIISAVLNLDP